MTEEQDEGGKLKRDEEVERIRVPNKSKNEILAVVETMLGSNRVMLRCMDGKMRMGRIPGKLKKRVWINEGDVVIAVPWPFQDEKADIVWRYTSSQLEQLERKGYLKL